jgi:hypothetical protein
MPHLSLFLYSPLWDRVTSLFYTTLASEFLSTSITMKKYIWVSPFYTKGSTLFCMLLLSHALPSTSFHIILLTAMPSLRVSSRGLGLVSSVLCGRPG